MIKGLVMKLRVKHNSKFLYKMMGIITLFAVLSGCHLFPIHHGSGGRGHIDGYNSRSGHHDSHRSSRSRSHSHDY